jgi:hypothetical protein
MQHDAVKAYLNGPFQQIGGWCSPWLWQLITPIAEHQARLGVTNPIAEIGVYHGKFFLGLAITKGAKADNHAIDVFDLQQFNLDGAGAGDMQKFTSNIERAGLGSGAVTMVRADSMAIEAPTIEAIRQASGGFSFFSVDGCHMAEHTMNDIRIAMQLTVPEGIIFVDDYTNFDWPGVHEGVARLYITDRPRFVPLAIVHNKLLLCHISMHATWLKLVEQALARHKGARQKQVNLYGYPAFNFVPRISDANNYLGPLPE